MSLENGLNPYAPSTSTSDIYVSRHLWKGRDITVTGGALASRLWLIVRYEISIDGRESFETAQASSTENFQWSFVHEGREVYGHFVTFGRREKSQRKYNLSIDGDVLGPGKVKLKGLWGIYFVWPVGIAAFILFLLLKG